MKRGASMTLAGVLITATAGWAAPDRAVAGVTRIVVETREPLALADGGGMPYETVRGRFYGELDPNDPHNALITDLARAPRNTAGRVEYSATFAITKPVDLRSASGVLRYDVANRGYDIEHLPLDGDIKVVSGWQGDLQPSPMRQTARLPAAVGIDGPVLTLVSDPPSGVQSVSLSQGVFGAVLRPAPVTLDTARALLFRQSSDTAPPVRISPGDWAFADCGARPFPGTPDPGKLCLRHGFDGHLLYGVVYRARDPLVLGMGFAATRDFVSSLRHRTSDAPAIAAEIADAVHWSIAIGTSQAGNFLRSFVHLGFNADERGHVVFDGLNVNIAARQVPLNVRFGFPGGAAGIYELGSEGALWWSRYDDAARHRGPSSLLARCSLGVTCPKIIETFGAAEFWNLRVSLNLVGTDAAADLALPANVRRYYFPGVTHGGAGASEFSLGGDPPWAGYTACRMPYNPNPSSDTRRVALRALVAWVSQGREPPASRYPTLAGGDLVAPTAQAMGWPHVPDAPVPDGKLNPFYDYDVGAQFDYPDESGIASLQPPRIRRTLPSRVPRVDADGNETSGIPSVQLLVPLGTYTGWNERAGGYGKGHGCGLVGGFIPFATTRAARIAAHDPRRSLQERYGTHQGFVDRVRTVAALQVAQGWLLPEDAARLVERAAASAVLVP